MSQKKKIGIGILVILLGMQFIRIDKTNPASIPSEEFLNVTQTPDDIASLIKHSCYDCHSNYTTYPWYSYVAPISFLLRSHIKGGRQFLNFSTWDSYDEKRKQHHLQEMIEVLENHRMPMKSYVFMHKKAALSDSDRTELISWIKSIAK